jgi:hypothetical protein
MVLPVVELDHSEPTGLHPTLPGAFQAESIQELAARIDVP